MNELNAIATIAYRDVIKFLRDRGRVLATLVFPVVLIAVLGGTLQAGLGAGTGVNFLTLTFTGVLAQTLFQSCTMGVVSLIEDRENDFSQEIFIAPISRYSIIFGKILGETGVSLVQGLVVVALALVLGIPLGLGQALLLIPVSIASCLLGGAFGVLLLANLRSQRAAQQIFNLILLPQYFLAGVFAPIGSLPIYLEIFSRISPMRYAVDLTRGVYYAGTREAAAVVVDPISLNIGVMAAMFIVFLMAGTLLFVRAERNR